MAKIPITNPVSHEQYLEAGRIIDQYHKEEKQRRIDEDILKEYGNYLNSCYTFTRDTSSGKRQFAFFKILKPKDNTRGALIEMFWGTSDGEKKISREHIRSVPKYLKQKDCKRITIKNFERNVDVFVKELQSVKIVSSRGKKKENG